MKKIPSAAGMILTVLEKTVDGYVRFEDFVSNTHIYAAGYERPLKKSSFAKAIKRVKERGLVELIEGDKFIKLSQEGKNEAEWVKIKSAGESKEGEWTIVIFDIPERKRQARDLLREKLKQCGFVHWQKSVWASRKDCLTYFRNFIKNMGLDNWVMVIKSTDVGWTKTPRS